MSDEAHAARAWLHDWWLTLRHTSRLTREGRTWRRDMQDAARDLDNPDAWVEVERPE